MMMAIIIASKPQKLVTWLITAHKILLNRLQEFSKEILKKVKMRLKITLIETP